MQVKYKIFKGVLGRIEVCYIMFPYIDYHFTCCKEGRRAIDILLQDTILQCIDLCLLQRMLVYVLVTFLRIVGDNISCIFLYISIISLFIHLSPLLERFS